MNRRKSCSEKTLNSTARCLTTRRLQSPVAELPRTCWSFSFRDFDKAVAQETLGYPTSTSELATWRARGLSKSLISRVIIGVTLFRVLITLLITYLLSPLPLQAGAQAYERATAAMRWSKWDWV